MSEYSSIYLPFCTLKIHELKERKDMSTSDLIELDRDIVSLKRLEQKMSWAGYQVPDLFEKTSYKGLRGRKGYKKLLKDISHVNLHPATDLSGVIEEMLRRTKRFGIRTYTYRYEVYLECNPGDNFLLLYLLFNERLEEKCEKYRRSFRCKILERELEKKRKGERGGE